MEITTDRIIEYIKSKRQATVTELSDYFGISRQAVHKQMRKLLDGHRIHKIGKPPKVFYLLVEEKNQTDTIYVEPPLKKLIDENFLVITPSGEREEGLSGFIYWCNRQKLPVEKTAREYEKIFKKYILYKKDGLIDGMFKIKHTFDNVFLDKVFYIDFYSIERFGKTKLGQLLQHFECFKRKRCN